MKIAIILAGHVRTFESTIKQWLSLRDRHYVHFYVSTWRFKDFQERTWWRPGLGVLEELDDNAHHMLCEELQPVDAVINLKSPHLDMSHLDKSRVLAETVLCQWHAIRRGYSLIHNIYEYDYIVRGRFDVWPTKLVLPDPKYPDSITSVPRCPDAFFAIRSDCFGNFITFDAEKEIEKAVVDGQIIPENIFHNRLKHLNLITTPGMRGHIIRPTGQLVSI